jgi:glycerol kinase
VLAQWALDASFSPAADREPADAQHQQWLRAVERSLNWES